MLRPQLGRLSPVDDEGVAEQERGRVGGGSGLGLSIVETIAKSHGGSALVADSTTGGADAWLSLPERPR